MRTELVFGLSVPGREGAVTEAEWTGFLADEVTPRFPDGLTVVDARGQWRNAAGQVTAEPSKVLVILHPPDPALHAGFEAIREAWKKRFGQESVMRVTSPARVSF
jgi:hypothetical protein